MHQATIRYTVYNEYFHSILFLLWRVTDDRNIGAHGFPKHNSEVTKAYMSKALEDESTTNTYNGEFGIGPAIVSDHGRVDSQSGTEHRGDNVTGNGIWDREHKSFVDSNMTSISTPSLVTIGIVRIISIDLLGTIILIIALTLASDLV